MTPPAASPSSSQASHQRLRVEARRAPAAGSAMPRRARCSGGSGPLNASVITSCMVALVGLEPEGPELEAVGHLRRRRPAREVDGHAVDGAPELVAVPAQQVALGAVGGDAEDVQARVLVAALQRELGRAPLGEPEQPPAELRARGAPGGPRGRPRARRCGTGRRRRRSRPGPAAPSATQASRPGSKPSIDQSFSRSSSVLSGSPTSATSQALRRSTISGASPRVAGRMRLGARSGAPPAPRSMA